MSAFAEKPNEKVIYEEDDLRVSTILKVNVDGTEMELEPGERIIIETVHPNHQSIMPMDFKRYFNGDVVCPFGITDAALAAILKFRFEQKRNREDTPLIDSMVYGEWIQTLENIIND